MDLSGTGSIHLQIDDEALTALRRALDGLPGRIRSDVIARAMRRVRSTANARIIRESAAQVQIPQKVVRERTRTLTAGFNSGGHTQGWVVRSGWIHLYRLGARRTRRGVTVRGRGSYDGAFIAKMKSGHRGVFRRAKDAKRLPIHELFGPNPANAINNDPDRYLTMLADVVDEVFARRVLHEITRLLPSSV